MHHKIVHFGIKLWNFGLVKFDQLVGFVLWHNGNGLRRLKGDDRAGFWRGEFWHDMSLSCLYWYLYANLPFNLSLYFSGLS